VSPVRYELRPKIQVTSKDLAVYDRTTVSRISRPLRGKYNKYDTLSFKTEVQEANIPIFMQKLTSGGVEAKGICSVLKNRM
jgi:hypothetical protein